MSYVLVNNGSGRFYSIDSLLTDNPDAVLSDPPTLQELASYNVYPLVIASRPEFDPLTQKIKALPISNVNGSWILEWEVIALSQDEKNNILRPESLAKSIINTQNRIETVVNSIGINSSETNADKVFRAIIMAYSIPGSYPEKVSAVDSAVTAYGTNGAYQDLYDHAVGLLAA